MFKIRKGDEVVVIAGKDKGKKGRVLKVVTETSRVIVENINVVKKHTKGNPTLNKPGGIIKKEVPLHVSNIAIVNPATNKPDRIGFRFLEDGSKVRFFKSNKEVIDR